MLETENQVWQAYELKIITLDEAAGAINAIQEGKFETFKELYSARADKKQRGETIKPRQQAEHYTD